jgi:hypothetical protein
MLFELPSLFILGLIVHLGIEIEDRAAFRLAAVQHRCGHSDMKRCNLQRVGDILPINTTPPK